MSTTDRRQPISRTGSHAIARFDGMVAELYFEDHPPEQLHVTQGDNRYRLSIPNANPLGEGPCDPGVSTRIRAWLQLSIPATGRTVADLVYDAWLRVRNQQTPSKVPTPNEVKAMSRKASKHAAYDPETPYAIDGIQVQPEFHLKVHFRNGEVRVVDVWKMRGKNPVFSAVFDNFDAAENRTYDVAWPTVFSGEKNTIEIEDQDLWGAGNLV